ncbi:FAD-dependent oxidoreductase [Microbacterium radiodurans]|uniref:D-amino-acid oxidase n=1 Tax=Microbacterium radiodurans TaxID=661398 RepID=A0A5J5ITX1_9MICO|nr:FAD-dependent oxidoreductase [Microbacterium radiodurans]KAA9085469.1 FAD-binding oxidoreductase [Microbacterium radiodurans]
MAPVTVVGAGVIGLSVAHELASAGHHVRVIADVDTPDTVSAVAAALWFPFHAALAAEVPDLLAPSFQRFAALAEDPGTGVRMSEGVVLERTDTPDRAWAHGLPDVREATRSQLRGGASSGLVATLPMIEIPQYLPWLRTQTARLGVEFERRRIQALDELTGPVVIAAGLRGSDLLDDEESTSPVRGQIVRVANPGLTRWVTDDGNPDGLTYVFPRISDVVVGGIAVESDDVGIDAQTQADILRRACALVPELAGQPVLGAAAGLRPARPTVRIEAVPRHRLAGRADPVIAAYGHGGAGVTLSWGTAAYVRDLLA